MHPHERIVTVITKRGNNSPFIQEMRANGAEIWTDEMRRASYEGIKRQYPDSSFKDMRSFYGKLSGQTAFICGSGPSLNTCPSKLPGPTFAVNRAIKHVQADYWCFSDVQATRDAEGHPHTKTAQWAFGSALHVFFKNVPAYLIEANGQPLDHKIDAERPLYWNGSTFSWVLHWVVKAAPKRIILIGCEFSLEGYFDGSPIRPVTRSTNPEDIAMSSRIVSESARIRVEDMFGPERHQWFDPNVEILDASNGHIPVPKTKLEEWL